MTAAYKVACFQVFCIPTEGDNDADSNTHYMGNGQQQNNPRQNNQQQHRPARQPHQSHQIHQPQQVVVDQQPAQQPPRIVQQTVKATVTHENGQYIVRDTEQGKVARQQNQQEKIALQKQLYQKQQLNEAQQAANVLMERHIQRSNEEETRRLERQDIAAAKGEAQQEKINEMAAIR